MIGVALKGLLGRKLRAALTAFAIVLGVAMVSGSFILTDTLGKSFDRIFDESYENADVVISSKEATSSEGAAEAPAFPERVLAETRKLDSVAAALGSVEDRARLLDKKGKLIADEGDSIAFGVDGGVNERLNPLVLVQGEWPAGENEIGIDRATADKKDFEVGQTIRVVANGPVRPYRISAIVQFGSVSSIGGATIAVFDLDTAQQLFDKEDRLDFAQVAAKPGVAPAELTREIRPLLPETAQVRTAAAQAESDSSDTRSGLDFIRYFLLAFGGIALFVGSFVIANTLSITVAQRVRELATLRTLGASRRQVLWSVVPRVGGRRRDRIRARALPRARAREIAERTPRDGRDRPPVRGSRLRHADGHREPSRRHRDRDPRQPATGAAGNARSPRSRRSVRVPSCRSRATRGSGRPSR